MSTTIYDSPGYFDDEKNTISIDITYELVWFFQNYEDEKDGQLVTVSKTELPAIYKAIGDYLKEVIGD